MKEKDFEDILIKYPELIEENLEFLGRQVTVCGRRLDILFKDIHNRKLIIELKIGPIKDQHMGQILSYEGMLLSHDDPTIRVMLVGNRVPPNIQRSLDHHGIAWKEISYRKLKDFISEKGDSDFIPLFDDIQEISIPFMKKSINQNIKEQSVERKIDVVTSQNLKNTPILNFLKKRVNEEKIRYWSNWKPLIKNKIYTKDQLDENQIDFFQFLNSTSEEIAGQDAFKDSVGIDLLDPYITCLISGIRGLQDLYGIRKNLNHVKFLCTKRALNNSKTKPALFIPVLSQWIEEALEYFKEGKDILFFYTNSNIGKIQDLSADKVYFKCKGENTISAVASLVEVKTENPIHFRLKGSESDIGKYYYGFKNLKWLNSPVKLRDLEYYESGKNLRNDIPGANIIKDPNVK